MALSLVTCADRGWTVVSLAGEIDVATAPRLREHLAATRASAAKIIVDLTDVGFLDSAGLGVLVGAMKRSRARGGTVRLVCPCPQIREVLSLTGVAKVFLIEETVDGAAAGRPVHPEDGPSGG